MRPLENFLGTFLLYSYIWTFLGAHCALLGPIVPKLKCRPDFFLHISKLHNYLQT